MKKCIIKGRTLWIARLGRCDTSCPECECIPPVEMHCPIAPRDEDGFMTSCGFYCCWFDVDISTEYTKEAGPYIARYATCKGTRIGEIIDDTE